MRLLRSTGLAAVLVAIAFALVAAGARADGDPPSDVLLTADTYFPYQPPVSANLMVAVNRTVANAKAAGFPLKVAIISSVADLGAVPDLYGKPQKYADFLDQEISFNKKDLLLVVTPQGFGVAAAGLASALAGRTIAPGTDADRLARAAIPAIGALAAKAGHPIALAPIPSAGGSGKGGTSAALTFGVPVVLVLLAALGGRFALARRSPSAAADDDDHDEDDA